MYNVLILTTLELMMFAFQILCWFWIFTIIPKGDIVKIVIVFFAVTGIAMSYQIKKTVEERIK